MFVRHVVPGFTIVPGRGGKPSTQNDPGPVGILEHGKDTSHLIDILWYHLEEEAAG